LIQKELYIFRAQSNISLNNYPGILFRLDMALAYHPAHRRNNVKTDSFFTGKYVNHFMLSKMYQLNRN
jgi:hypothetical protein